MRVLFVQPKDIRPLPQVLRLRDEGVARRFVIGVRRLGGRGFRLLR